MDLEFIKSVIYDDGKRICAGEKISKELIEILRDGTVAQRSACFDDTINIRAYLVETECSMCHKGIEVRLTKTKTLKYISGLINFHCNDCKAKIKEQNEFERKEQDKKQQAETQHGKKRISEFTDIYINAYIDPEKEWKPNTSGKQKTSEIVDACVIDDEVADYINQLDYYDFLKTPYWQAISLYAKYLAKYRCALCGCSEDLVTHHKTYERHGYEHKKEVIKEDLIVLCNDCHEKFHNI